LIRIGPEVEIKVIQSMSQVTQCLIAKTILKGGIEIPLDLVQIGIERYIFEAGKIMPELPGIDIQGGINHLSAD
jgi:hypothetical protein